MKSLAQDEDIETIAAEVCEPFTLQLRSDGILHSHTSGSIDFNIDSMKRFNVVMGNMLHHKKAPLLITLDEFAIPPVEVREFWSKKESCLYALADAYLVDNFGHKFIGNFYLKFNKPGRPTRIFTTMEEAIDWLKTFL